MKRKRIVCLLLALALTAALLTGCSAAGKQTEKRFSVVVSIFPAFDWVRNLLGEAAEDYELLLLADNGIDLHSYQPSMRDLAAIASCDLLICVGGESEAWLDDALQTSVNADRRVLKLLELLGDQALDEELLEGMQEDGAEETEQALDEHVWLAPETALLLTERIADRLAEMDEENAARIQKNASDYEDALTALAAEYRRTLAACPGDTLLFADRFPFRYVAEAYGLRCSAAFSGCSAETEAGFSVIVFLSEKLKTLRLPAVLVLENSDTKLAATVISTAGVPAQILRLNAMQSITRAQIDGGASYLAMMRENLAVLQKALSA